MYLGCPALLPRTDPYTYCFECLGRVVQQPPTCVECQTLPVVSLQHGCDHFHHFSVSALEQVRVGVQHRWDLTVAQSHHTTSQQGPRCPVIWMVGGQEADASTASWQSHGSLDLGFWSKSTEAPYFPQLWLGLRNRWAVVVSLCWSDSMWLADFGHNKVGVYWASLSVPMESSRGWSLCEVEQKGTIL